LKKIAIIGGGPAGIFAAYAAAEHGAMPAIFERNPEPLMKFLLAGGGNVNFSNDLPLEDMLKRYGRARVFLKSAFYKFTPEETAAFFGEHAGGTQLEAGKYLLGRENAKTFAARFPQTLEKMGVQIRRGARALEIKKSDAFIVRSETGAENFDAVILTTGGLAYPRTGSSGDGFGYAKAFGHAITECVPALSPINVKENVGACAGISPRSAAIKAASGKENIHTSGDVLFTHRGISGPAALDASAFVARALAEKRAVTIEIDFMPDVAADALEKRADYRIRENGAKEAANVFSEFVPRQLFETAFKIVGADPSKKCAVLTRDERRKIVKALKSLPLTPTGVGGFDEAMVTSGGVAIAEVDKSTMESRIMPGLYFAGEILDYDGPTGGFNIQAAISTGYLAGANATLS